MQLKNFFSIIFILFSIQTFAQLDIQTAIPSPNQLYQCADSSQFMVTITNTSGNTITDDIIITIDQPAGVIKVGNSIAQNGGTNIVFIDANNGDEDPVFTITEDLPAGQSIVLSYWAKALCSVADISHTNIVTVSLGGTTLPIVTTLAYGIQVPFLELMNPETNTTDVACQGDQFTQVIRVRNNGNFNSFQNFLDIEITHSSEVGITNTSIGTVIAGSPTIVRLSGSDFSSVGDFDNRLDYLEEIEFTITGELQSCISNNTTVSFQPLFRCELSDAFECRRVPETTSHTLNVTNTNDTPQLSVSPNCNLSSSVSGLQITNTGTEDASNVTITVTIPDDCDCQAIDINTFLYQINGGGFNPITIDVASPSNSSCFAGNPSMIESATFEIPTLSASDVLNITWNAPLCGSAPCNGVSIYWDYSVVFQSTCCPNTIPIASGNCGIQPELDVSLTPNCVNGTKELVITNNGNNTATDVNVRLSVNNTPLAGIDPSTVALSSGVLTNGSTISSTPEIQTCTGNASVLSEANYIIDEIPVGGSTTLSWNILNCLEYSPCSPYQSENFSYAVSYDQSCANGSASASGTITSTEGSQIADGNNDLITEVDFSSCVGGTTTFSLPIVISGASLSQDFRTAEVVIDLPDDVIWDNTTVSDLNIGGNPPLNVDDSNPQQLIIQYDLPLPTTPSTINLTFTMDCNNLCNGVQEINYNLNIRDDCNNALLHNCNALQFFNTLNNPNAPCPIAPEFDCLNITGPTTTVRTSFGDDDGDDDRYAGGGTGMVLDKLLMFSDILETTFEGTVVNSLGTDTLVLNIIMYNVDNQYDYVELLDLDVTIFDQDLGVTYNIANVLACSDMFLQRDTLGARVFTLTFTETNINNCYTGLPALPANFTFGIGDRISYNLEQQIIDNVGLNTINLEFTTDSYLVDGTNTLETPPAILLDCPDISSDGVQITGFEYQVYATQNALDVCNDVEVTLVHDFNIQSAGNVNVFTDEYREWAKFRTIEVTIPDGFTCDPSTSVWTYITPPHNIVLATTDVPPFTQVGNLITFDLYDASFTDNFYVDNNISVDDGNRLDIQLTLSTDCRANPINTLRAVYNYAVPLNRLPEEVNFEVISNTPEIVYNISSSPVSCTGGKAVWEFTVSHQNTSPVDASSNYYNWLDIELGGNFSPPAMATSILTEVGTPSTPILQDASGFYLLGNIPKGDSKTYHLEVDYDASASNCNTDIIKLFYGWDCESIEMNYTTANYKANYTCDFDSTELAFQSGTNVILMDFDTQYSDVSMCEENDYVVVVRNVGQSNLQNISVNIIPPTGFTLDDASFTYTYDGFTNTFMNGHSNIILPTFPGALSSDPNTFEIAFKYTTDCLDGISDSPQFIIEVQSRNCCDEGLTISNPSLPLDVEQSSVGDNNLDITLSSSNNLGCSNPNTTLTIDLENIGTTDTENTDQVLVTLPAGLEYVASSLTGTYSNLTISGNEITWNIDPVMLVSDTRQYTLQVNYTDDAPPCEGYRLRVQTFQTNITACENLMPRLDCSNRRFTGSRFLNIDSEDPSLSVLTFTQTSFSGAFEGQITLMNTGTATVPMGNYDVGIYCDAMLQTTITVNIPTDLNSGDTYVYTYAPVPDFTASCFELEARLDAGGNCLCSGGSAKLLISIPLSENSINLRTQLTKENSVLLHWNSNITNVDFFEIERSLDGQIFEVLNRVGGIENLNIYQFLDTQTQTGNHFYRILAYNQEGTVFYSDVVKVDISSEDLQLKIAPNPFEAQINLEWVGERFAEKVQIQISDTQGKTLWFSEEKVFDNKLELNLDHLRAGLYVLKVFSKQKVWVDKIVKR